MSDELKVRGDIPVSLHPTSLANHAKVLDQDGTLGVAVLNSASGALKSMYETFGNFQDAEIALVQQGPKGKRTQQPLNKKGPPSSTSGPIRHTDGVLKLQHGKEVEFAEAATVAFDRVGKDVDKAVANIKAQRDALQTRVNEALIDPTSKTQEGMGLATEIRAHVKSLDDKDRLRFLNAAVEASDLPTVTAALTGPAFLSGLNDQQRGVIRTLAAKRFAPQESAQIDTADAVLEHVMTAAQAFVGRYEKILHARTKADIEAKDALEKVK